jgi:hypothetical protein
MDERTDLDTEPAILSPEALALVTAYAEARCRARALWSSNQMIAADAAAAEAGRLFRKATGETLRRIELLCVELLRDVDLIDHQVATFRALAAR